MKLKLMIILCLALAFTFSVNGSAIELSIGQGLKPNACPVSVGRYDAYDNRCSTPIGVDFSGNLRQLPDVVLVSPDHKARVTHSVALAGSIASIRLDDGFEFVHSGGHGAALTLVFRPDTLDRRFFPEGYATFENPSGFTACYNPTEEGSRIDSNQLKNILPENSNQLHGSSSTRIGLWKTGLDQPGQQNQAEWFGVKTNYANFLPANQFIGQPCLQPIQPKVGEIQSSFIGIKKVSLSQSGAAYILKMEQEIEILPGGPNHQRISASQVLYLANKSKPGVTDLTLGCILKKIPGNMTECNLTPQNIVSKQMNEPAIVSDEKLLHAIGLRAKPSVLISSPSQKIIVRNQNFHAYKNSDAWKNRLLSFNWIIEAQEGTWIETSNQIPVKVRSELEFVFGSFAAVRAELSRTY